MYLSEPIPQFYQESKPSILPQLQPLSTTTHLGFGQLCRESKFSVLFKAVWFAGPNRISLVF